MEKINFGVIGCGYISKKSVIPAINDGLYSSLIAVCDIDVERMKIVSQKYHTDNEEDYSRLLNRKDIDAVYIATPIGKHTEICIEAAQKGKHILCEKSLTSSLDETEKVIEACEDNHVALLEGFMYQYHTQHAIVRDLIRDDRIGQPVHFHARFGFPPLDRKNFRYSKELGGGSLLDAGAYTIHAARNIFNKEPIKVNAVLHNEGREIDVYGSALLDFGKETASLVFGFNNFYQNTYSVWGTRGLITLKRAFSIPSDLKPTLILEQQDNYKEIVLPECNHFDKEIEIFCKNISNENLIQKWRIDILNQSKVISLIRRGSESN